MSVHFHEPITRDSEGLVEVAVACEGGVEPAGDLRLQPARREAYLPVPPGYEGFPLALGIYDAIEAWLDARSGPACADSPYEVLSRHRRRAVRRRLSHRTLDPVTPLEGPR